MINNRWQILEIDAKAVEIKKLNTNWCNSYESDGKTIEIDEKQRKAMQKQWDKSVMMKCKTIK